MGPLARFARLGLIGGRLVDATFAPHSLDRGEFDVLASLRRNGAPYELTPSRLASVLLVSRGGMTKRIDRLEARGLVRRIARPSDRRSLLITLTDDGRRLIDELVAEHVVNESRLLAVLDPEELAAFDGVLRKLLAVAERVPTQSAGTTSSG
ncbi:MarR family transcriptional regulator [Protaetiibacter larvae]|uniref:MarR family transcriptional regulator n=2 Tax=Protaetiibacter larvae TaxID=2592654 RepID=A0A5C1YBI5_9MICO|nr:MarR family transcriptional regulator [Protaetiibacter larvae]